VSRYRGHLLLQQQPRSPAIIARARQGHPRVTTSYFCGIKQTCGYPEFRSPHNNNNNNNNYNSTLFGFICTLYTCGWPRPDLGASGVLSRLAAVAGCRDTAVDYLCHWSTTATRGPQEGERSMFRNPPDQHNTTQPKNHCNYVQIRPLHPHFYGKNRANATIS